MSFSKVSSKVSSNKSTNKISHKVNRENNKDFDMNIDLHNSNSSEKHSSSSKDNIKNETKETTNKKGLSHSKKERKEYILINLRENIFSQIDKPNKFTVYLAGQIMLIPFFVDELLSILWIYQIFWVEIY